MTDSSLVVAPCSYAAAKHAVEKWHYSERMPRGKLILFGVWEEGTFIGSVMFGRGAIPWLGKPYGLDQTEICELVRVALCEHSAPVTQIVALCLGALKDRNPGLRLIVSFADPAQEHHGGIYQAGNWVYSGTSSPARFFVVNGRLTHPRTIAHQGISQSIDAVRKHIDPTATEVMMPGKHRYLYPLDKQMARRTRKLAQPYPQKAGEGSIESRIASSDEVRVQLPAPALTEGGNE